MNNDEPTSNGGLIRLRLDISYDGEFFNGWAKQEKLRTVQGELERIFGFIFFAETPLTCAGRTDSGVHARGQVAHMDVPENKWREIEAQGLYRLNRSLAEDVRVLAVQVADKDFDARFSALARTYSYRIADGAVGPLPLNRKSVLSWPDRLNDVAMAQASDLLLGEHDFTGFCRRREFATTIRTIQSFTWERTTEYLCATVTADAFCHSMVRSLMGALTAVGEGRKPIEWPASMLNATERASDVPVLPPHGLTLEHVRYPSQAELAARAADTKKRRQRPDYRESVHGSH